jgi:hypothetical protein
MILIDKKKFIQGGLLSYIDIVMISISNEYLVFSLCQTLGRSLFLIWGIELRRPKF